MAKGKANQEKEAKQLVTQNHVVLLTPNGTSLAPAIERRGPAKVINFKSLAGISQADLEEYLLLKIELSEARKLWKKKRNELRAALEAGARVDRGVHVAEIQEVAVGQRTVRRLLVR